MGGMFIKLSRVYGSIDLGNFEVFCEMRPFEEEVKALKRRDTQLTFIHVLPTCVHVLPTSMCYLQH